MSLGSSGPGVLCKAGFLCNVLPHPAKAYWAFGMSLVCLLTGAVSEAFSFSQDSDGTKKKKKKKKIKAEAVSE